MARKHDNNPKRTSNPQGKTGKGRGGQSRSAASKNSRKFSVGEGLCPSRSTETAAPAPRKPRIKTIERRDLCRAQRLTSPEDIDAYVAAIRKKLETALADSDTVSIK